MRCVRVFIDPATECTTILKSLEVDLRRKIVKK
jgi:hypothetical protein